MPTFRFSFFFAVFLTVLALATPLSAEPDAAKGDDNYTIKGVKVDVKAENSNAARDKAFMEGGRNAFKELVKRLNADDSFDTKSISDTTIGKLIKSFEVENEKASGVRYVGTLTYHFKPDATADLFEKKNMGINPDSAKKAAAPESGEPRVPFMPEKTLILPLVRASGRNILWEEKTPWHKAWESFVNAKSTPDFLMPEGGVDDVAAINATEALAGLRPPLQKIMERYGAHNVVIASLLSKTADPNPAESPSIQLARFDGEGIILETHTIDMRNQEEKGQDKKPDAAKIQSWLQQGIKTAITALRNSASKNKNFAIAGPHAAPPPPTNTQMMVIRLTIPFASQEEWSSKREMLRLIPGVNRIDITSLNRFRALAQIVYQGTQSQFDAEIQKRQMKLAPPPVADGSLVLTSEGQDGSLPPSTPQAVFQSTYPQQAPAAAPSPPSEQTYEPMQVEPMPVENQP